FAGLAPPPLAAGRSLRPMMQGARDPERVIPSFYGNSVTIRKGDYRIIRYASAPGVEDWQLFDLRTDYWQLRNLLPDHPAFAPLRKALEDWAAAAGYVFSHYEDARPGDEDGERPAAAPPRQGRNRRRPTARRPERPRPG